MHCIVRQSFGGIRVRTPLVVAGQRVGILGGSFNPPHAGHRLIAGLALKRLGLDRLWWLVTPGNPLKSREDLLPLAERLAAARALADDPRIVVTSFEDRLGTTYSAAVAGFLRRRHPGVRFVWVMGADNLATLHHWRQWRMIAAHLPIAVLDRPGWRHRAAASKAAAALARGRRPEERARLLAGARPPAWTLLTGPLSPLSSTALRAGRQRKAAHAT